MTLKETVVVEGKDDMAAVLRAVDANVICTSGYGISQETIELIRETGCIAEVNTRGIYKKRHDDYYPSRELLCHMNEKHIPVIVSTDAHCPEDLLRTEGAYEYLRQINYRNIIVELVNL